jgi:hypothetical protein
MALQGLMMSNMASANMITDLPAPVSRTAAAWADLVEGSCKSWMWSAMAMQDIKLRYRGSVLGPFWLTISMVIMVTASTIRSHATAIISWTRCITAREWRARSRSGLPKAAPRQCRIGSVPAHDPEKLEESRLDDISGGEKLQFVFKPKFARYAALNLAAGSLR